MLESMFHIGNSLEKEKKMKGNNRVMFVVTAPEVMNHEILGKTWSTFILGDFDGWLIGGAPSIAIDRLFPHAKRDSSPTINEADLIVLVDETGVPVVYLHTSIR